jgi:hypothetical protein
VLPARRIAQALMSLLALGALALGATATPAGAVLVEAESGAVKVGEQPHSVSLLEGPLGNDSLEKPFLNFEAFEFENPSGAPVLPASHIYAIYWDPTDNYHGDWQQLIDGFFEHMGAASGALSSVFAVDSQYTDKTNQRASYDSIFMGASQDSNPYPTKVCTDPNPLKGLTLPGLEPEAITCVTDAQVQEQLKLFIAAHHLPTGMGSIFYVLTPPGVTVCLGSGGSKGQCSDYVTYSYTPSESKAEKEAKEAEEEEYAENSFCSYHSDISPTNPTTGDANTIIYGVIPWTAGDMGDSHLADSEEQTEAFNCQDGGFNPSSKPVIEEREKKQEKTKKQEEEEKTSEKTAKEKAAQKRQERLEGPHEEEPNQLTSNGPDGAPDTGLADLIISQIGAEQQDIVTDPLLNAWHDSSGKEATDECRNFFSPTLGGSVGANEFTGAGTLYNQTYNGGNYYINDAFNLGSLKLPYPAVPCVGGVNLAPHFTAPNPVEAGELVGFNGMESDVSLNWGTEYSPTGVATPTYAVYKWNFGDGSPEVTGYAPGAPPGNPPQSICEAPWKAPCAASTFHSYQYGGTYAVTLTITDTGGHTNSVTHQITVVGPPPPSSGENPGGETGSTTGGGGASTATTVVAPPSTPSSPPGGSSVLLPGPVATAAATSSSLKQVAKGGLVVRYTVNEQVAGHFEVLLNAATARSLGIGGRLATELPAGSPKSLVIGQALLVTTKGGHSSVRIKFSKRIAKRLRRARKVVLTLRLKVRNASKSPLFTTVTSTVVLHH